jgi:hypothetical protein
MSKIIIDLAAEFTGKKAFKQADSATARLNKSVRNLAGAFGLAFSTRAVVNYSKMAVKAFADDDKAAQILTKTLQNLGLQFADPQIKTFIADLEKQFGVLDDQLRPAYQKLITTTGDFRKSQDLLKVALDLSAMSGESVVSAANDLSQAIVGNTKGLRKYNLGLTTAQLSAMSFEEVLVRLAKVSQGQASLAADTYSGKLAKLEVAASNAQEVIGGALLDSFIKLSGGDVDKATTKIDNMSTALANLIRLATGTSAMSLKDILNSVDYKYGFIPVDRKISTNRSKSPAGTYMRNAAEIKAAAEAKKLAQDQAKIQNKLLKSQQDALKLSKAKAIFDLQKIQIEAALKGKISEEDRIRLKLMQAIENENIDQIDKYTKMLDEAQRNTEKLVSTLQSIKPLDDVFKNWNFMSVKDQLASLQSYFTAFAGSAASAFNALGAAQKAALGGYAPFVGATNASLGITSNGGATTSMPSTVGLGASGTGNQLPAGVTINTTVQGSVITENDLNQAINDALAASGWAGTAIGYGRQAVITAV